ncbi:hypothetical protein [Thalassotalea ganghwensis]
MKGNVRSWGLVLQLIVAGIMLIFSLRQGIELNANILSALPQSQSSEIIIQAEAELFERFSDQIIVSFQGQSNVDAYQEMLTFAKQQNWQIRQPSQSMLTQLVPLYAKHKGALLTQEFLALIQKPNDYQMFFNQQLSQLVNPFISETFGIDPSLSLSNYVETLITKQTSLTVKQDYFLAQYDQTEFIVLFLEVKNNPAERNELDYAIETQQMLFKYLQQLSSRYPDVNTHISGVLLHTAENAQNAQWEMSVFGSLSLLFTLFIVYLTFRRVQSVIWIVLTVGNAIFMGIAATFYFFESVHVLTIVLALPLVGIAVDYCIHVLSNHFSTSMVKVTRTLFVAFFTTVLSYFMFFVTPLVVLKQVAVFVIFGLMAAFIASVWLEQFLSKRAVDKLPVKTINMTTLVKFLTRYRLVSMAAVLTIVILSFSHSLNFDDNVSQLNASSKKLMADETLHHQLLGQNGKLRLFVWANSIEQLLQNEESLAANIKQSFASATVSKLSDWLPSIARQTFNKQGFLQAFENGNLSIINRYVPDYHPTAINNPLTLEDFPEEIKQAFLSHRFAEINQQYISVVEVSGVSENDLSLMIKEKNNVVLFNKQSSITEVLSEFRAQLSLWLLMAVISVFVVFTLKFGWGMSAKSLAILVVTLYCALYISFLIQGTLTIFNLLSAILVLGLAVDYLIFYREHQLASENVLAISLSCASSLFVFGMLVFSQTPAIFHFGLTVTLGLLLTFLMAPLVAKESYA